MPKRRSKEDFFDCEKCGRTKVYFELRSVRGALVCRDNCGKPPVEVKPNYYSPKRRAIMRDGEQIDHLELFEAYAWKCHLCGEEIDRNRRKPDVLAATVDHVIPLSKGGTHTWDNVRPAHAKCNFAKSDKILTKSDVA